MSKILISDNPLDNALIYGDISTNNVKIDASVEITGYVKNGLKSSGLITSVGGLNVKSGTTQIESIANFNGRVNLNSTIKTTKRTIESSVSKGTKGEVAIDENYIYICTATNKWKRVALDDTAW